jgi:hypothetical protein
MKIYDRWGNQVYQGSEWDGRDNQNGVYSYTIFIEFMNGNYKRFFGDVTLVR